jgi:potassium-transporting ATPase potassium-binding subunit
MYFRVSILTWFQSKIGLLVVYALQTCQDLLPLNPQALPAITTDSAFNTAISFATNTNWQGYAGEASMS